MARTLPIRTFVSSGVSSGAAAALAALALACAPGTARAQALPADGESAVQRLEASPRHGEWVKVDAGGGDMVEAWVADQLAAEGYIAIAPDLLSGKGAGGAGTASFESQAVGPAIRDLDRGEINRRLRALGAYGMALPAAAKKVGAVGYCWGGTSSWLLAVDWPDLDAAVVYYGSSPQSGYDSIQAPVLAFYGGNDNRVNATIPTAEEAMKALGRSFEPHVLEGAGHGFLRQQSGQEGANLKATEQAWPRTVAFFREHLGR